MHLESVRPQRFTICGETIAFAAGETIHTENSYKYTLDSFADLARSARWKSFAVFCDPKQYFAVHVLTSNETSR